MLPMHVAVVPLASGEVTERHLLHVVAALQKQVIRDLGPIWGVAATVAPFRELEQVPPGYWPLVLVEDIPLRRRGVHFATGGRPFALVKNSDSWSLMASHELLELLVDPWGNWTLPGRSPRDDQGQVEFLVEVCDPCQRETYLIDGVLVSDFVTPQYYAPLDTAGARYSFRGTVSGPREVLPGGYITWRVAAPDRDEIWQKFGPNDNDIIELGTGEFPSDVSMREWVDSHPPDYPGMPKELSKSEDPLAYAADDFGRAEESARRYGAALRRDIERLREQSAQLSGAEQRTSERDKLIALLGELATDDAVREAFHADPAKVLAEREITAASAFSPRDAPLPRKEDFAEMLERLLAGDRFGEHMNQPLGAYWSLAVLGGG
jgi:hypothetical protein